MVDVFFASEAYPFKARTRSRDLTALCMSTMDTRPGRV